MKREGVDDVRREEESCREGEEGYTIHYTVYSVPGERCKVCWIDPQTKSPLTDARATTEMQTD